MAKKSKIDKEKEEKLEKLHQIMNETNRTYGEPIVKFAKDEASPERTLTKVPDLDGLFGGFPSKRFSIVWGAPGTAKTSLAYLAIAEAQRNGKICAYINQEGSFEVERALLFGIDVDSLVVAGPFDTAEQAMDVLVNFCREKIVDLVVLDSIQSLSPSGEQETKKHKTKSIQDDEMALLARKLSKFFRISTSGVYKGDVTVILIGQTRTDLGGFIALDKLSGGNALVHMSALTLCTRRGPKSESPTIKVILEEEDEKGKKIKLDKIIGFQLIVKLDKVKISGTQCEGSDIKLPFFFGSGFNKPEETQVEVKGEEDAGSEEQQ